MTQGEDPRTDSAGRSDDQQTLTRRGWLQVGGASLLAALAGCPGSDGDSAPATTTESGPTTTSPPPTAGDGTTRSGTDGSDGGTGPGTDGPTATETASPSPAGAVTDIRPMESYAMNLSGLITSSRREDISLDGVGRVDGDGNSDYAWTIGNGTVETEVRSVVLDGTSYTVVDGQCTGSTPGVDLGEGGLLETNESALTRVGGTQLAGEGVTTFEVQNLDTGGEGAWNATIYVSNRTRYPVRWEGALQTASRFNATLTAEFRDWNSSVDIQVPDGC